MFIYQSIRQYHEALGNHLVTCSEMVSHFLEKIEASKDLNSFVEIFKEESLARAAELDNKRTKKNSLGKLHGVVISIKDVIKVFTDKDIYRFNLITNLEDGE